MSEIETLISDFKHRGWESEPMDKVLDIAHRSAADAARLAHRLIDELPKGSTFFDAVLSFVPLDEWPELVLLCPLCLGVNSLGSQQFARFVVVKPGFFVSLQTASSVAANPFGRIGGEVPMQQQGNRLSNLRHGDRRSVFFSPAASLRSGTMWR